jgi:hypothetical protein
LNGLATPKKLLLNPRTMGRSANTSTATDMHLH